MHMVSVKMFRDPNNNFSENVSRFWMAYSGWIQSDKFDYDLVASDNIDEKYGLNVILDNKKDKYEAKINEYLKRFDVGYLFSAGKFIKIDEIICEPNVQEVLEWIDKYPDAAKAYRAALKKISEKQYARNAIDDMRLSIESLIRSIMGTNRTLENQIQPVGAALKNKGVLPQAVTFITTMLTHYTKYQNDNVKHHDTLDIEDIEMIVSMTAIMMKYIKDRLG